MPVTKTEETLLFWLGPLLVLTALVLLCLLPWLVVGGMQAALLKLHLSPAAALLVIVGLFAGSFLNLPLTQIPRDEEQPTTEWTYLPGRGVVPLIVRSPLSTTLAVNVGGCLIPLLLALYQTSLVVQAGAAPLLALLLACTVNVVICHRLARPVRGVGILLPAFIPPLLAIGAAWLLLPGSEYALIRAPVAFTAGVLGPLLGADLLRLRDLHRIAAGVVSIGGAGTFDGIVLSGLFAALLA